MSTVGVPCVGVGWICSLCLIFMFVEVPLQNIRFVWMELSSCTFPRYGVWRDKYGHQSSFLHSEEGRRTLYKAFGIKFVIIVQGRAGRMSESSLPSWEQQNLPIVRAVQWEEITFTSLDRQEIGVIPAGSLKLLQSIIRRSNHLVLGKFDLKNTVINIVAGLGLLSFITMFCDFVLLHYVKERKIVSLWNVWK